MAAARALVYAGLGFVLAGLAAGVVIAVALPAGGGSVHAGVADVAQMVGGAAFGGAIMGAAGALIGTATRNPTVASSALPSLQPRELSDGRRLRVSAPAAIGLLLAFLAAFALFIRGSALPRDLT